MVQHPHEALIVAGACSLVWGGITLLKRLTISIEKCDAIGVKTCKELEGKYCEFAERCFGKPVLLAGPAIPQHSSAKLENCMDSWLKGFDDKSVVYCALGSEFVLDKEQFQELVLGLELTGRPFLAALKPPIGFTTIESALPEGLEDKIKRKGIITSNWVQQKQILDHPSVGFFMTHCGSNSVSEALLSECQLVLMPQVVEQFIHARLLSMDLKVGIEVEKTSNGIYTRDAIHNAISIVMDTDIGNEVRGNHLKWKEIMQKEGLEDSYVNTFIQDLKHLIE
ncbi:cyanidin 3-O-galactoside 2''-O-xylosyltransferase FGGT1-like [Silene latifolia]|uniref:cyanidin 3-O-galactoside 2''-O-xylosyltransferase FGGT1-like n=1 Tax=Silene latifolia TaxID=37657 RepID=UPI003D7740F1